MLDNKVMKIITPAVIKPFKIHSKKFTGFCMGINNIIISPRSIVIALTT